MAFFEALPNPNSEVINGCYRCKCFTSTNHGTPKVQLSVAQQRSKQLKFGHSKKATKFEMIFHLIWRLRSKFQIKWKIVSNFVAFLENLNFTIQNRTLGFQDLYFLNFVTCMFSYIFWHFLDRASEITWSHFDLTRRRGQGIKTKDEWWQLPAPLDITPCVPYDQRKRS